MTDPLNGLKPFQRSTVHHVFRRLYSDSDHATHFLVADEVGLGKTMVAQGVIAKAVDHLTENGTKRIDIVYLCSNQSIAGQNLKKLRHALPKDSTFTPQTADRLTLLALGLPEIEQANRVNFFSLTPGTSFNLGNALGKREERRFLYYVLVSIFHGNFAFMRETTVDGFPAKAVMRMLKGGLSKTTDAQWYSEIASDEKAQTAVARLDSPEGNIRDCIIGDLRDEIIDLANVYPTHHRSTPDEDIQRRVSVLIRELRRRLATASIRLLQPDLIIMDEFQRFSELIDGKRATVVSKLVHELTNYTDPDTNEPVRMLLLSATPYRHLTLDSDGSDGDGQHRNEADGHEDSDEEDVETIAEGDHRDDFAGTLRILFGADSPVVQEVGDELKRLRHALMQLPDSFEDGRASRRSVQEKLLRGIARTERVDTSDERHAMTEEMPVTVDVKMHDLQDAQLIIRLARAVGARSPIEFWKSAPYLLNFMNGYKFVEQIEAWRDGEGDRGHGDNDGGMTTGTLLTELGKTSLQRKAINLHKPIPARNGRLRALMRYAFEGRDDNAGSTNTVANPDPLAGRVWMPPALPYHHRPGHEGSGETRPEASAISKALVFSSWQVVPDTAAGLLSYEAERHTSLGKSGRSYFGKTKAPGINDAESNVLTYASPTLAQLIDPMAMCYGPKRLTTLEDQRAHIVARLREEFPTKRRSSAEKLGPAAQIWQAIVDRDGNLSDPDLLSQRDTQAAKARNALQRPNDERDYQRLADFCLGSPATCALRALLRVTENKAEDLVPQAVTIGGIIVRLMNRSLNAAHILDEQSGSSTVSWVSALRYAARHDLQSVLDEWFHILANDARKKSNVDADEIANAVEAALSIAPSAISVRDVKAWIKPKAKDRDAGPAKTFQLRGYFAMRLASAKGEGEDGGNRIGNVKSAFCSPFAPFVLTTTSVGQEGLDFHPYCHRVYHWNLPSNPVDLEQREGRVHRFKGHALRLNLASHYAANLFHIREGERPVDPWTVMFDAADAKIREQAGHSQSSDGRAPSWVLDGAHRVKRIALNFAFSTEGERYKKVRADLTRYRLAFGQARQDDLMEHLRSLDLATLDANMTDELQITLRPDKLNGR